MREGDFVEIRIEDMLEDGRAFGRCEGFAVFVSGGAVPGDLVRAKLTKIKSSSAEAECVELREASKDRIKAGCRYFGECGGCSLQEMKYEAQLEMKRSQLVAKLERLGGLDEPKVNECIGAENLKYYRNKATFSVGPNGEVGFVKGRSHFVMDIPDCMLQSDAAMACAGALRTFLAMDETKGLARSVIRQMTVRTAFGTGEVMVVLDSSRKDVDGIELLVEMLDDAVYGINNMSDCDTDAGKSKDEPAADCVFSLESVAIVYGSNPGRGQYGKCRIVAGRPTIIDEFICLDGSVIKYEISPQSFFQVNPEQMGSLYNKVAEYVDLRGFNISPVNEPGTNEDGSLDEVTVLDLYCGAGTIGLWLLNNLRTQNKEAFRRTKIIGIESVKPAVLDANRNSVINGFTNTRYICGKAEEELPGMMGLAPLYKWNEVNERVEREPEIKIERVDAAILDPPRGGSGEALLAAVAASQPGRIVYVSCDPATLARDVKYLCSHGYDFVEATPLDMFPWTTSTESCSLLIRREDDV